MNKEEIVALDKDFWIIRDNGWGPGMFKWSLYFKGECQASAVSLKDDEEADKEWAKDYLLWCCPMFNWEAPQ